MEGQRIYMKYYPAQGEPQVITVTPGKEKEEIAQLLGHSVRTTKFTNGQTGFCDLMSNRRGVPENPRFQERGWNWTEKIHGGVVIYKELSRGDFLSFSAEELKNL